METTATVAGVADVGPDTVAITFETPAGFDAAPGQFVRLAGTVEGEEYRRFYTLSSPRVGETFEVTVGVSDEGGPFSAHLAALAPGDELGVAGPFGENHYEGEGRVVVLAGGPGVGPALAVAERALADGGEAAVVYRDDAPAHEARLDALREAGASVVVTDGPVDDATAAAVTGAADEAVFVYGFQAFVDEAVAAVERAGADPEAAKVESFG
jgi:cytochrome-b5 reductase